MFVIRKMKETDIAAVAQMEREIFPGSVERAGDPGQL